MSEQADVPSQRAGGGRQFEKSKKARAKRRIWKVVLKKDGESPRNAEAYDGHYKGWMS